MHFLAYTQDHQESQKFSPAPMFWVEMNRVGM